MTTEPSTPTVDTDELRELLREAASYIPAPHTLHAARADEELRSRIVAALARPVPAAPAEPGRVMFDGPDVVGCRACGDPAELASPDAGPSDVDFGEYDCDSCGYQFGSDDADVCRRCLLPAAAHRGDAHWTALGIDREGEPLAAPAEPGATEVERGGRTVTLPMVLRILRGTIADGGDQGRLLEQVVSMLELIPDAAALAAPPAPADEGQEEMIGRVTLSGAGLGVEFRPASPAPAVPEERDEATAFAQWPSGWCAAITRTLPTTVTVTKWESSEVYPTEAQALAKARAALAARPAPEPAAPTEHISPRGWRHDGPRPSPNCGPPCREAAERGDPEPPANCAAVLGSRPSWMSVDQYDPCHCDLPEGHEPSTDDPSGHSCRHVRPAAPTEEEAP